MHYSFKSTPTWTMKGRTQTTTKANQGCSRPGPSDYQVKKPLHQSQTIASTKQQRNLFKPFQPFPGPGSYQSRTFTTSGPKRSMSARYIDYSKRTPGPHDYNNDTLKVKIAAPGFSMSRRSKSYKQIVDSNNIYKPSPSQYDAFKGSLNNPSQSVVIGSSNRRDLTETEKTPGPNYYMSEKAHDYASNANPRCKIGSQFRKTDFKRGEETPGPAFYKYKSYVDENKQKKKGFSCRQKTKLSKVPGPGMYESHIKNKHRSPTIARTNSARKTFMDDTQNFRKQFPGPGHHQSKFSSSKYRATSAQPFGRSNRKSLYENQKTPAPVEYSNDKMAILNKAPGYSVGKTLQKQQFLQVNPENPGPGQYDPNILLVKQGSKSYEVPKQKRPDFEKQRQYPGPGYYNLRGKQEGPGWKFKQQKRVAFTDRKSEAKDGRHYQIPNKVVDPPNYMKVVSKIQYSDSKTAFKSTGFSNK